MQKLKAIFSRLKKILMSLFKFFSNPKKVFSGIIFFLRFCVLLLIFMIKESLELIGRIKFLHFVTKPIGQRLNKIYMKVISWFDTYEKGNITSMDIIYLALKHLKAKKTRTIVTIGGMAIGFGAVVLLLSLGYGFQRLVVSRVARLEEMRQIDVTVGQASSLVLDDETIESFQKVEGVEYVLPVLSVVSKVSYNNSVSDVVAYAVTSKYLEQSAIQPSKGEIFESDEIGLDLEEDDEGEVAGASVVLKTGAKMGAEIYKVNYAINPVIWKAVYEDASEDSKLIGYTKRVVGNQEAREIWGHDYAASSADLEGIDIYGNTYNRWINDSFPIWIAENCDMKDLDCVDGFYKIMKENSRQAVSVGYITEKDVVVDRFEIINPEENYLEEGKVLGTVNFSLDEDVWVPLYSQWKVEAVEYDLFTKSIEEEYLQGELVLGRSYQDENRFGAVGENENGQWLGYWIRVELPIWRKVDCQDCSDYYLMETDDNDEQLTSVKYIPVQYLTIDEMPAAANFGQVLGEATASAEVAADVSLDAEQLSALGLSASDAAGLTAEELAWVEIASEAGLVSTPEKEILSFHDSVKKVALINRAMARLLGVEESKSIGEVFQTTFVLDSEFFNEEDKNAESTEIEYKIIGVIPEEKTPAFYLPFIDLKGLGIDHYSQVKVVVKDKKDLPEVRTTIESMGFKTSSVVDTIDRINSFFTTIRIVLVVLGMIALGVAALGMFNTLTVSLMEKTREVGLMKAMGMQADEVQRLFLAESIIIGLAGGVSGLLLGFLTGKIISVILSTVSVTKGMGLIDVTYIPVALLISILILSSVVGILTGIFPARRATKISALNALRYE
jgi:ABC-type lipoprotein release transport system permease subunit